MAKAAAAAARDARRASSSAAAASASAVPDDGRACTAFIISHPTHQLSRKLFFVSPPSYADLVARVHHLLSPSPLQPSEIGLSYLDSERRRHVVDCEADLLELYAGVGDSEEIRLRVLVKGGAALGLKEIDELLRKMLTRADLPDGHAPTQALAPLTPSSATTRPRRSSTVESAFSPTPSSSYSPLPTAFSALKSAPLAPPGLSKIATPPLGPPPGLSKIAFLSSPLVDTPPSDELVQRPASVESMSWPVLKGPWPDHLPPRPTPPTEPTSPPLLDPTLESESEWFRAESAVRSIRRLVEDFPAPLHPKSKGTAADGPVGTHEDADDVLGGLRQLVEDLRAGMHRMDEIHAQTIRQLGEGLQIDPGFSLSPSPSPPLMPVGRLPSPAPPHLYHPIPEHPILRPTFRPPPSRRSVPAFAPDLDTPPRIASPTYSDTNADAQGSWAFLPTALDLDLDGAVAHKPSPRSPLPSFVLGPQKKSDSGRVDKLYPMAQGQGRPPPPPARPAPEKPSLAEFPPLSAAREAALTRNGKQGAQKALDGVDEDQERRRDRDDDDGRPATDTSSLDMSLSSARSASSTAASSVPASASSAKVPVTSSTSAGPPAAGSRNVTALSTSSRRDSTAQASHALALQSQLTASASAFVSQQPSPAAPHSYADAPHAHANPQQQPFLYQSQSQQQQSYGQAWMQLPTATNANGQAFVCMPYVPPAMAAGGQALGWPANVPGTGTNMAMFNGQAGVGPYAGGFQHYGGAVPGFVLLQQQLYQQQQQQQQHQWRHQQTMAYGARPPQMAQATFGHPPHHHHHSSSSSSANAARAAFPPFLQNAHRSSSSSSSAPPVSTANGAAAPPPVNGLPPVYHLPPPPAPGQTTPPQMAVEHLPAYLRLYGAAFADGPARLKRADEALARMRRAEGGVVVGEGDSGGWIEGADGGD